MISHKIIAVSSLTAALAACSSSSSMTTAPAGDSGPLETSNPSPEGATDTGAEDAGSARAVIGALAITSIRPTLDPRNGHQNPYGLAIAPASAGLLTAGDLVICNFNDSANVQGNGTTIEILPPTPGSTPTRMVQDPNLKGCAALAIADNDAPWAAAYSSNLAPFYSATGALVSTLSAEPWAGPWGEAFAPAFGATGEPTFITSNSTSGTIVRVNFAGTAFTTIATGFTLNSGAVPGNILGASGLTYDAASDTLFVVDSNMNRVVAFAGYSTLGANAVVLESDGTFSGPA